MWKLPLFLTRTRLLTHRPTAGQEGAAESETHDSAVESCRNAESQLWRSDGTKNNTTEAFGRDSLDIHAGVA